MEFEMTSENTLPAPHGKMKMIAKTLATAVLAALMMPNAAFAKCSHSTKITNDSGYEMRFVELKSAVTPPTLFKKQWTGERVIKPGSTGTINWTSDWNCTDGGTGAANHWDVKLKRKDGNVHYCGNLSQSQGVTVKGRDLCFPN
jgi:hypothetical protein